MIRLSKAAKRGWQYKEFENLADARRFLMSREGEEWGQSHLWFTFKQYKKFMEADYGKQSSSSGVQE